MKKRGFCLGVALIVTAHGAAAKEVAPNDVNKPYLDPVKRERRFAAPENLNQTDGWQPYLSWHREARSLQGLNDRSDSLGAVVLHKQL